MNSIAPSRQVGAILDNKFQIIRLIGEGGMGAVYEIEHVITKHRRALKLLHPEMNTIAGSVERFYREASAAGRIGNAHIVETFDAGELDTGEPYLVMELLTGEPLSARLERSGKLSVEEIIHLGGQICDAIHAAHEAGIVHRDMKPDNVWISRVNDADFVKILDFGISKFSVDQPGASLGLTTEGSLLGTPYYMSVEQMQGRSDIDRRTDVYSIGVILYECAAGRIPFQADTLAHLAILVHEGAVAPLEKLRPGFPVPLAATIRRAMAPRREERFETAAMLRDALARTFDVALAATQLSVPAPALRAASLPPESLDHGGAPVSAETTGATTQTLSPVKTRQALPKRLLALGAVLAVVALAAWAGIRGYRSTPQASETPVATPPVESVVPAVLTAPAASSRVIVVNSAEPESAPAPEASDSAGAPAPVPGASAHQVSSSTPTHPKPTGSGRAGSAGLATDNPF